MTDASDTPPSEPVLRVVKGHPTHEELAALVAVVASLGAPSPDAPRPRSQWNASHRLVRGPWSHGPGGWRASALPR